MQPCLLRTNAKGECPIRANDVRSSFFEWRVVCCVHQFAKTDRYWAIVARSLSRTYMLYVPRSYRMGWKRLFWEQLYPSRHKWQPQSQTSTDYKIRVSARFRPRTKAASSGGSLLIPLHQRLQLMKDGRIDEEEVWRADSDVSDLRALVERQKLSPLVKAAESSKMAGHAKSMP